MELRARTRQLRRAAMMACVGALIVPAAAGAATKHQSKAPVITSISPKHVGIGDTLLIRGHNFVRGNRKNTVVFKRDGAPGVFVKAGLSTERRMKVKLPVSISKYMKVRNGGPATTRFRLRILARRFGKAFTKASLSPLVSPTSVARPTVPKQAAPDGDCDGDGIKNSADTDDDNDLLPDTLEKQIGTNPCNPDSDGDGVSDGYEYQSALDLNDDNYQNPNRYLPYPGKRPYPNPLYADSSTDYDGDSLTLGEEYKLWRYSGTYSLSVPLSYSDGRQYSVGAFGADGRWHGTLVAAAYAKQQHFLNWAATTPGPGSGMGGYLDVLIKGSIPGGPSFNELHDIRDFNLNGSVSPEERMYYDYDGDGLLSDDERDEDGDGLTNFDELHGRLLPSYWSGCYTGEVPYPVAYAGTDPTDADSDGDGVLDGADDQDHDGVPNLMEMSRYAASGEVDWSANQCRPKPGLPTPPATWHADEYGRVNPFNPCLPFTDSITCTRHPGLSGASAPFDGSPNWYSLQ
jgi:hypothetical protein